MNIRELKLELANNIDDIGLLKIQYRNKPEFTGYIKSIDHPDGDIDDVDFTLKHHIHPVKTDPYVNIDFENMQSITIKYKGPIEPKDFFINH